MTEQTKKTLIQSLDRALNILELVRDAAGPMRSSDIAEQLGLGVATAHNIIRSLYQRGYLAQDENNRYLLGAECFKLCKVHLDNFEELRRVVDGLVSEIAEQTGHTTFFGVEYFGSLYCAALSIGGGALVVNNTQEWLDLLHCTAAGKIIIAEQGSEYFAQLCKRRPLTRLTPKTVVTVEGMAAELEKIHRDGYALSIDECSKDISALGIAVYDKAGKFIGALAQSFPTFYIENGTITPQKTAELLQKYAEKISNEL